MRCLDDLKYLRWFYYIYISVLVVSITAASHVIKTPFRFLGVNLVITGGTLIVPICFFIQDIITETYGYLKSKSLIQVSTVVLLTYYIILQLISFILQKQHMTQEHATLFYYSTLTSRHILAFIGATFTGMFINSLLLSKSKIFFKGKRLAARFIVSTMIGELFFLVFAVLAWWHYLNIFTQVLPMLVFSYIYRILFESASTPLNYAFTSMLKKSEGVDAYDIDINYNPFRWN